MSSHESANPDARPGPPSAADRRMAQILGTRPASPDARDELRKERTDEADDLLGRLNAMDFIDSVLGEDYELPEAIGGYEITGVLGRGGMGTVYRAYQENLDREIALKVLAPRFSSDVTMRKRFRKEAKATAAMHHQHIVPIYGYGESSGHLFFAMELVDGISLDKLITVARRKSEGALEPLDAARRFAGVADALALAHKRKILHRDVKPGNLLVHTDGTLALADFGLSKFLGDEPSAHLTSVGGFLGTLHYSAPEQARGEELGPASDLYSFGVTLFETLTGRLPVSGDSTEAMLHALLHDEPPRLRQVLPKAPRDLEAVLDKLLQKHPRDRYQDGEALGLDLIRVAEGEPVRIRRQRVVTRVLRRIRRNPVMSTAVAVVFVLLVVTVLYLDSLSENKSINRASRGRQHLADASIAVAKEPGSAVGPFGILNALTGSTLAQEFTQSQFLAELEHAERMLPDEAENIARYRRSYAGQVLRGNDGSTGGAALLMRGNGFGARRSITESIREFEARSHELGRRMDLYNLFVGRAIAAISASVADPAEAISDLNLAVFIRPGAFVPAMVRTVLTWAVRTARTRPDQLLAQLAPLVNGGDAMQRRTTAQFLLAFAGICPPPTCHLMRFPLTYGARKILCDEALKWLGADAERGEVGRHYGLEFELAGFAAEVLAHLGDRVKMTGPLQAAQTLLMRSVGDDSPLRAWYFTFDLLGDEDTVSAQLDRSTRLQGAIHYVRLVQEQLSIAEGEPLLRRLMPRVDALLESADAAPGAVLEGSPRLLAVELRARLHAWVAAPEAAAAAAKAWRQLAPRHPEASLCVFCSLVRAVPASDRQCIDAFVQFQNARDHGIPLGAERIRRRVVARVRAQLGQVRAAERRAPFLDQLLGYVNREGE